MDHMYVCDLYSPPKLQSKGGGGPQSWGGFLFCVRRTNWSNILNVALHEMAIPPSPTSSLSSDEEEIAFSTVSLPQEEDTLFVQGRLVAIVMDYIVKLSSEPDQVIGLLDTPEDSDSSNDDFRNLFKVLVSGIQDLRAFFSVPNNQIMSNITPIPNPNEVVAAFIDFLLQILLEILRIEPYFVVSVKASIKLLRRELEFLITFLGDTPMTLQPTEVEETNDILTDIQFVVNDVGSFLYSLLYNWHDQVIGILDLALSDLLSKFELLKTQIKEYCITVSKFPSCITPR
ncbi:NB-ARC domain-containing protein [Forsythia ovata]|uniref:NB-ARC domain-containing protein n=1 Tax=Forsythia ovata TaxID=205694 RepID=A0ABD1WSX1_9LAMI